MKIPVCAPGISSVDVEYVTKCIESTWVSGTSPVVKRFEKKFAKFSGCDYGVAVNSGTTALHTALVAMGIGKDDEVIMPTFTMIASPNSVAYTGGIPVLVDSDPKTWNIDLSKIEEKITKRTKAIMPVHTYGNPVDMVTLMELAKKHNLLVIEDAAEAHGATYSGKSIGSFGDVSCYSFYANKIITTGEGGMIVTNNKELAERCAWLRAHAFGRGGEHFFHEELGFGYRMSGLQAALGLAQMERIHKFVNGRITRAFLYTTSLSHLSDYINFPPNVSWAKNVYWMYSILLKEDSPVSRDELMAGLEERGIETRTFFYPVHVQPIYKEDSEYPVADMLSRHGINLPSGNDLSNDHVRYVCDAIEEIFD